MQIKSSYDTTTGTFTHLLWDETTSDAVLVDPVLEYDPISAKTALNSIAPLCEYIQEHSLRVHYILETHAHADHLSASQFLKLLPGFAQAKVAIGKHITKVQQIFAPIFGMPSDFACDGSQFDQLLDEEKTYQAGSLTFTVVFAPGHTPACAIYKFDNNYFVGDVLFQPDVGVGRCDFPGGSAADLYDSVQNKIYSLPEDALLFMAHDYPGDGLAPRPSLTVAQAKLNKDLPPHRTKSDFVEFRQTTDATLSAPRLLYPSVQVNIDAGHLPPKDKNGQRLLRIPISEPSLVIK